MSSTDSEVNLCLSVQPTSSATDLQLNVRYCMLMMQCTKQTDDTGTHATQQQQSNIPKARPRQNSITRHTVDHVSTLHASAMSANRKPAQPGKLKHSSSVLSLSSSYPAMQQQQNHSTGKSAELSDMQSLNSKVVCIDVQLKHAMQLPVTYCRNVYAEIRWRYGGTKCIDVRQLQWSDIDPKVCILNNCPIFTPVAHKITLPRIDSDLLYDISSNDKAALTIDLYGYETAALLAPQIAQQQYRSANYLKLCRQLTIDPASNYKQVVQQRVGQLLLAESDANSLREQLDRLELQLLDVQQQHKTLVDYIKQKKQLALTRRGKPVPTDLTGKSNAEADDAFRIARSSSNSDCLYKQLVERTSHLKSLTTRNKTVVLPTRT